MNVGHWQRMAPVSLVTITECDECLAQGGDTFAGAWWGPCFDGQMHRESCSVARRHMRETRWPNGAYRFPELRHA
jgi:hypothetical protein